MKVEVVQRDGGADAEERVSLCLCSAAKKKKKTTLRLKFALAARLLALFLDAPFSSTARFTVFGLLPGFLSTNTK